MKKNITRLVLLAAMLLAIPTQMSAVVWYTTQADGTADPNDRCTTGFMHKDGTTSPTLAPNTKYCRIYKYLADSKDADNNDNFDDPELRYYIAKKFGYRPTGYDDQRRFYITKEEADTVTKLNLSKALYPDRTESYNVIKHLTGIEIFANLEELDVSDQYVGEAYMPTSVLNSLQSYDSIRYANANIDPGLREGYYSYNLPIYDRAHNIQRSYKFRYLGYVVRFFPKLKKLTAQNCQLYEFYLCDGDDNYKSPIEEIDLSRNYALSDIYINNSEVTSLNLTGCWGLKHIEAAFSSLPTLDLSTDSLGILETIYAPNAQLSSILVGSKEYKRLEIINVKDDKLTTLDIVALSPKMNILKCQNNQLTSLNFHPDGVMEQIYCAGNKITSLDLRGQALKRVECQNNEITELLINDTTNKNLFFLDCSTNKNLDTLALSKLDKLEILYCYSCNLDTLGLGANVKLKRLRISNNKIPTLDLTNNPLIWDFYCNSCDLDSIKGLDGLSNLKVIMANYNNLTSLNFANLTALETAEFSKNKFTELDLTPCTNLKTLFCDAQGGYGDTDGRLLKVLKLNNDSLTTVKCDNNSLLTLDLSNCPNLTYQGFIGATQRAIQDLKVFDNSKVCIELPNGYVNDGTNDPVGYFHTWETSGEKAGSGFDIGCSDIITRDGKDWLVVYDISSDPTGISPKADVDFYGKNLTWCYYLWPADATNGLRKIPEEALGKSVYFANENRTVATTDLNIKGTVINANPDRLDNNVSVKTYPFIMYINPNSQDNFTTNGVPFWSGTIYLDYDAIVPAGCTAYIAKGMSLGKNVITTSETGQETRVEDQLQLVELVPGEGATEVVIPALTPVYVKSTIENTDGKLFGFDRNNHGGVAQPLAVLADTTASYADNILKGTLTDSAGVTPGSVYMLGRGQVMGTDGLGAPTAQSRIGFWPYAGRTIKAHRVYILAADIPNEVKKNMNSRGFTVAFNDDEFNGTVTGIQGVSTNLQEGWYTVSGIRLNGKPTEKGVYIHNGRKEVIR